MAVKIQIRGGTSGQWTTANPVLGNREPAIETDTLKMKVGDGSTRVELSRLCLYGRDGRGRERNR